ncbi:MAG: ribonuclease III [Sphingomonadales bacterium]|nr:ribonuclease III [Sphingomonadales bacterium]
MTDGDLSPLYDSLGYRFQSSALLRQALSHASLAGDVNYERLEFLGDRVLGLVVAEWLLERYPKLKEGPLAQRLAALVKRETLAEAAKDLDLARYVLMSRGAEDEGGRTKPAILADCCEAVIGAIYLDGGLEAARGLIRRAWARFFDGLGEAARHAKTDLQEWAQGRGLPAPTYREVERSGPDHAPQFVVAVDVEGFEPVTGEGSSKRTAEVAAAEAMYKKVTGDGR